MIRIFEDLPVDAGFTCKPADGKVYRADLLKKAPVVRLSLVHGSEIAVIRSMQPEGAAPLRADTDEGYLDVYDADGAVTDLPGVYLTTTHGDCVPIWTCDPVKGVVGVAHAGWRGTAAGIVKNADMDEGLTNWTVKGEVAAERFRGYGERIQKRHGARIGQGDGVATFTTKADSPNELSQELSGLQPGKLYAVICCVADRDDIVAKAKNEKTRGLKSPLAFSVRLEGATEYPNLRYETVSAVRAKVGMRLLRYVFRADSDKARLVFTDRKDDGSAAPEGFKQSLNYISCMPYYVASPDDPDEIAATLGWKDANRVRDGR